MDTSPLKDETTSKAPDPRATQTLTASLLQPQNSQLHILLYDLSTARNALYTAFSPQNTFLKVYKSFIITPILNKNYP
jgi:hypothetical protein